MWVTSTFVPTALSPGSRYWRTAFSAAFSMIRTIIGVAKTGGRMLSLNWLARCDGPTSMAKLPFAPNGMSCMRALQIRFGPMTDR